ncbi:MAG: DegV family protein [Peptococcaceae bacterium]|nr:DegV family protein [Peptococcaceae bacterium]
MIKIATDSVSDLPSELIEEYGITIIPLHVNIEDQTYLDGVNITSLQVCEQIKNGHSPSTSQIPPSKFYEVFEKLTSDGDEVIAITMSSQLSGTYNSAMLARQQLPDRKIEILDSMGVSLGQGLQVLEAARMALLGMISQEIITRLNQLRNKMNYAIIIDSLDYLFKGGRISKVQYIAGNLLNLNIVCGSDGAGKISVIEKFIGKEKNILKWIGKYLSKLDLKNKTVGICTINNEALLSEVKSLIQGYCPKEIITSHIGSTVACYAGPNAIGIFAES